MLKALWLVCVVLPVLATLGCGCSGSSREVRFCNGHVTGAPQGGRPGAHITWTASYSTSTPEQVIARYTELHGEPSRTQGDGRASWSLPPEGSGEVISVAGAATAGLRIAGRRRWSARHRYVP